MGRLDDIQAALKPLKKSKKLKYIFMTILGLAESFKTYVPEIIKYRDVKFLTQSSFKS